MRDISTAFSINDRTSVKFECEIHGQFYYTSSVFRNLIMRKDPVFDRQHQKILDYILYEWSLTEMGTWVGPRESLLSDSGQQCISFYNIKGEIDEESVVRSSVRPFTDVMFKSLDSQGTDQLQNGQLSSFSSGAQ
jgi:hypothetical protein